MPRTELAPVHICTGALPLPASALLVRHTFRRAAPCPPARPRCLPPSPLPAPARLPCSALPRAQAHKIEDQLSSQVQELQAALAAARAHQQQVGWGGAVRCGAAVTGEAAPAYAQPAARPRCCMCTAQHDGSSFKSCRVLACVGWAEGMSAAWRR